MSKHYLGLKFYEGTKEDFLGLIFARQDKDLQGSGLMVVTPNPEMIVEMKKNPDFALVMRGADFRVVDGVGLFWALRIWGQRRINRITGTDLFVDVLRKNSSLSSKEKLRIFLLGAGEGVAEKVRSLYPDANIVGVLAPDFSMNDMDGELICQKIVNLNPDVVFVAFGAPKQEFWIWKFKKYLVGVRYVIGVGGAFDFVAGEVQRAPRWMQKYGLEWLYRLKKQPFQRLFRICRAVLVFPVLFISDLWDKFWGKV